MGLKAFGMPNWDEDRGEEWDVDDEGSGDEDDGDKVDWDSLQPAEAGQQLSEFLLALKHEGHLSARQCCVIAFWACKSGAVGPANTFALHPGAQSGHYQRNIDKVLTQDLAAEGEIYELPMAMNRRSDASRVVERLPVLNVHERLWEEVRETPQATDQLRDMVANGSLPPAYWSHPVVMANQDHHNPVHPVALYLDGVPTHRHDGVLAVYAHSLVTDVRHLVACLRKHDLGSFRDGAAHSGRQEAPSENR